MSLSRHLCVVMVCLLCLWGVVAHAAEPAPKEAAAPQFATLTAEGLAELLEKSKGKVVLVNFFASWCEPCKMELEGLVRLRKAFTEDDVVFVGLALDHDLNDLKTYVDEHPLNYPFYTASPELPYIYNVEMIPHNAIYDRAGAIVGNQPGLIREETMRQILATLVEKKQ